MSAQGAGEERIRFVKMRPKGDPHASWCICEPCEVDDMRDGEPIEDFELQDVWMTPAEVEALPEFEGW